MKDSMEIKNCKLRMSGKHGIISIATMLVLGAVVVQIGLVGFILSYYLTSSNAGVKFSSYAFSGAQAGIAEGIVRILRNDYAHDVPFMVAGFGGTALSVTICKAGNPVEEDSPCNPDFSALPADKVKIVSAAGAFSKKNIMVAIVEVDPITHAVRLESIVEKDQL